MRIHFELEVLAVLLFLTPIISDGEKINKCDVMNQLLLNFPEEEASAENLVAKIICYAKETSDFTTSFIHESNPQEHHGPRNARDLPKNIRPEGEPLSKTDAPSTKSEASTLPPNPHGETDQPRTNPQFENPTTLPPPNSTHRYERKHTIDLGTLYGIFQLPCDMCDVDCDNLIDDDITDDVQCLLTVLGILPRTKPDDQDIKTQGLVREWRQMFEEHKCDMVSSSYLDECKSP